MRVDDGVEKRLREAYSGAIGKDADRISRTLVGITNEETVTFVGLGLYVAGFIVNDIYPDGPTDDDVRELAAQIIEGESGWMDLGDDDTVARFLKAAATGDTTLGGLGGDDLMGHAIVCGGHLLSHYRLAGQRWYQYLDEIWAIAEAAPDAG